jgi:hypothetical protein
MKVVKLHSEEYRKEVREQEILEEKKKNLLRGLIAYTKLIPMAKALRHIATQSLEYKRNMFLFNMKARLIQYSYKQYLVTLGKRYVKRCFDLFTTRKKLMFRKMVQDYRKKKRVRQIILWSIRLKLKTKLMTGLIIRRTKAVK